MKATLFALALALGMVFVSGTGGGLTSPRGHVLDIAEAGTGGGLTSPRGHVLDFA